MSYEAVAYRACCHETPLWAFPSTGDGRYNAAGSLPTQYLAQHPMTPWAELLRNLDCRTADTARAMRLEIWGIRVLLADGPEEIDFDTAGSFGLAPGDLVSDDHGPCRSAAAELHADGVHSFSAPSAALPGTTNLVLLEPAVVIDCHAAPLDEDWPTALLAHDGRCPENVWEHIHYRGAPAEHPALAAWRAGADFTFTQPEVTAAMESDRARGEAVHEPRRRSTSPEARARRAAPPVAAVERCARGPRLSTCPASRNPGESAGRMTDRTRGSHPVAARIGCGTEAPVQTEGAP